MPKMPANAFILPASTADVLEMKTLAGIHSSTCQLERSSKGTAHLKALLWFEIYSDSSSASPRDARHAGS